MTDLWGNIDAAEPVFGAQMGKTVLQTHSFEDCKGEFCCLHNPSSHPLDRAPLNWRGDRGMMERICGHGVGHPDPDDLAFKRSVMPDYENYAFGVHGCDGCCR